MQTVVCVFQKNTSSCIQIGDKHSTVALSSVTEWQSGICLQYEKEYRKHALRLESLLRGDEKDESNGTLAWW